MQDYVCIYGQPASFMIYPKDGIWSFSQVYDILKDCQNIPCLSGAYPLTCAVEGGFAWSGTVESTNRWYKNIGARNDSTSLVDRQIRTYGISAGSAPGNKNDWQQLMPLSPDFNDNMFKSVDQRYYKGTIQLSCIRLRAKCNPSMDMVIELCRLLGRRGHIILETEGFKLSADNVSLTPRKTHKYVTASQARALQK